MTDIHSFTEVVGRQMKAISLTRFQAFKELLKKHLKVFQQLDFWKVLLVVIRQYCLKQYHEPDDVEKLNSIFEGYQIDLAEMVMSQEVQRERKLMSFFWYLYDIKRKINYTFDINKLTVNLFQEMSAKNVQSIYISLFQRNYAQDDNPIPLHSDMILAYDESGLLISGDKPKLYFTRQILPNSVINPERRYSVIIMPLINWEDKFGIIALPTSDIEPIMYEFLREEISNIIYTITTFQQKKAIEEKLEYNMKELKKSEERFKDMATFLPTIIMETDLYFRITYLNKVGLESFQVALADLEERPNLFDYIFPEDVESLKIKTVKMIQEEHREFFEFRIKNKDKLPLNVLARTAPIVDNGLIKGIRWNAINLKIAADSAISPDDLFFTHYKISAREKDIILLLMQGLKIKDIAQQLFISVNTVKTHITMIYSKTGVDNKSGLFEILKNYHVKQFGYQTYLFSFLNKIFQ